MPGELDLAVIVQTPAWRGFVDDAEGCCATAARAAWETAWETTRETAQSAGDAVAGAGGAEAAILLADDAFVHDLNRRYRGVDRATNVLSFAALDDDAPPAPDGGQVLHLGDVVMALETVRGEAARDGKAPAAHLSHLVVHGVLHLLGYDHEEDGEAAEMEALETRILAGLGFPDPYAEDPGDGS